MKNVNKLVAVLILTAGTVSANVVKTVNEITPSGVIMTEISAKATPFTGNDYTELFNQMFNVPTPTLNVSNEIKPLNILFFDKANFAPKQ